MLVLFDTKDGPRAVSRRWVATVLSCPNGEGVIVLGFGEDGYYVHTTEPFETVVAKLDDQQHLHLKTDFVDLPANTSEQIALLQELQLAAPAAQVSDEMLARIRAAQTGRVA